MKTCIIPHAGKKYAGDCRHHVLSELKTKTKIKLLYIAAVHEPLEQTYVFNDYDNIFPSIEDRYIDTHTWAWVKDELFKTFPKANVTILYPNETFNLSKSMIQKLRDFIVIGTTDLIHNFELKYTWNDKIHLEGQLINQLINNKLPDNLSELCCGSNSVRCVIQINQYYKLKGRVLDYYDSTQSAYNGIERYTFKKKSKFVSYVGILWGTYSIRLLKIDIKLALGAITTILNENGPLHSIEYYLPIFCNLYKTTDGIFISTKQNGQTNSCVGTYDTPGKTTAELLYETIQGNYRDSIMRWGVPIKPYMFTASFELLEPKKYWKQVDNLMLKHKPFGVYIYNKQHSATFLPVVWKENDYTPSEVLSNLKSKAGMKTNEPFKILLYKAIEYTFT